MQQFRVMVLFAIFFGLASACSSLLEKRSDDIIKPASDARDYRYLQLSNGLKVILVSDMKADKAAASLDVFAGSAQNPIDRPGLAHFVEHMLFLGTEKYPEAGGYQKFISENGGSHNAYTSFEHTNYFFEVNRSAFEPTLDRFAQFFIAPLFDEAYLEREKHAVNAEYKAGIKSEERRQLDVLREIANPAHPFSRFSVGSLESLSSDATPIRDDVVAFYQRYYSASNMTLAVLAPESLDDIEKTVRARFLSVKSGDVNKPSYDEPLFLENTLPGLVTLVPEQDRRSLSLLFPMPDQQAFYRDQPLNVIGHILGHEGEHSIYQYLKERNWAEGLVAGQGLSYEGVTVFSLSVQLTTEGLKHKDEVLQVIYSQINSLKKDGIAQWVFDELKEVSELEFAYKDKGSESHAVTSLSNDLHYYAPNEVLHANYSYERYDKEKISELLDYLSPDNMLIINVEPNALANKRSVYYAAPYAQSSLSDALIASLQDQSLIEGVQLPEPNAFIPDSMKVLAPDAGAEKTDEDILPALVLNEAGVKLWYKGIDRFQQPKLDVNHYISQHGIKNTAEKTVLMSLYVHLLNDDANAFLYDANMAGLYASASSYQSGINIRTYGFSDKQAYLVPRLIESYQGANFNEAQFQRIRLAMVSELLNAKKKMPYQQLMQAWRAEMQSNAFSVDELLAAVDGVSLKQVHAYASGFWSNVNVEALINGNISQQGAVELTQSVLNILAPLQTEKKFSAQASNTGFIKRLSDKKNYWRQYDLNHNDAAYLMYWQADNDSTEETALWLLLSNIMESGYYHQLRTQEQLGYIVFETYRSLWRVPGIMFVVQSPEAGVERLHQSTFSFLHAQMPRLGLMSDAQLAVYKNSLSASIQQRSKNLASETQYYQRSLFYKDNDDQIFKRKAVLAKAVEAVNAKDWSAFIQRLQKENYSQMLILSSNEGSALEGFHRLNKPLSDKKPFIFPQDKSK